MTPDPEEKSQMRFTAFIMHQDNLLARVSIDDKAEETLSQHAMRARSTLVRDANRHRSEHLSDAVLEELAEIYANVVVSQTLSREGRIVTCTVHADKVSKMEGDITILTRSPKDLTMRVEALTDAWIAERSDFLDGVFKRRA
jgi:hypothetical protein